jgi:hypothetical protein
MDRLKEIMIEDSCTPLFGIVVMLVFRAHCFLRIDAIQILKVGTIIFYHLAEDQCLDLLQKFPQAHSHK